MVPQQIVTTALVSPLCTCILFIPMFFLEGVSFQSFPCTDNGAAPGRCR
jgi:hypothetical protein